MCSTPLFWVGMYVHAQSHSLMLQPSRAYMGAVLPAPVMYISQHEHTLPYTTATHVLLFLTEDALLALEGHSNQDMLNPELHPASLPCVASGFHVYIQHIQEPSATVWGSACFLDDGYALGAGQTHIKT